MAKSVRTAPISMDMGKIPPQNIEIEEAVLGALMIENGLMDKIGKLLRREVFYREANGLIYEAIESIYRAGEAIDILTVTNALKKSDNLEQAGGYFNIAQMTNKVASGANIMTHCRIIQEQYFKRELIMSSSVAIRNAYDETIDVFTAIQEVEAGVQRINELISSGGNMGHIGVHLNAAEVQLKERERRRKEGMTSGISAGIYDVNKKTGGWQNANLIILAARPGMGKTALMLHFAKYAATLGHPVCIYSLEMSAVSLTNRLILSEATIDTQKFRGGNMSDDDWRQFAAAKNVLGNMPIYVDDNPVCSMRYIKGNSAMMKRKGKCDLILCDYLQLADMEADQKSNRNREQEVSAASREAKIICKTLDVPFILLSQLNRAVETRQGNKRPALSDLRESGAIEQDADIVAFIYRDAYYGIETDADGNNTKNRGELIFAKHRDGATFSAHFGHNDSMTQIFDLAKPEAMPSAAAYINDSMANYMPASENFNRDLPF